MAIWQPLHLITSISKDIPPMKNSIFKSEIQKFSVKQ
jgi:hypothetical protein